jgi:acetylornithine aminotransferase/acetylornithine/N-succinyldiaminopimelate aminotransferase
MEHHPSLAKNYAPPPFNAVKGQGVFLYDDQDKQYLDFTSGIAVTALGHSHPKWTSAVQKQLHKLVHCSNLFGIPSQQQLADKLVQIAGPGRLLFCNSGAEANEALIKLARLHGLKKSKTAGHACHQVITATNAFHGRTFGCMAATPQDKIQKGFHPMLEGFRYAEFNNIESFKEQIDPSVAAIMIETIQGEGGIFPAKKEFLQALQQLCQDNDLLLIIDEVQCGIGRTGDFFAYQESGIIPDAIGMAKGLGGGFPIGAIWIKQANEELFQPGSHGTTFGGNPLASVSGNAVIDTILEDKLLDKVKKQSKKWHQQIHDLKDKYPNKIHAIRGKGYMVGISVDDALALTHSAREKGLLIVPAGHNTIRLLPPLIAEETHLNQSIQVLDSVFKDA